MRNKPTRFYSSQQEKVVANVVGGRKQANSGAGTWQKGDVVSDVFLIECKTHTDVKKSTAIKLEWLEKIREESLGMRKDAYALAFDFGPNTERYYIIDERMFRKLNNFLEDERRNEKW